MTKKLIASGDLATGEHITKTNAQRQAAWRQRRKQQGQATLLLQAHLPADLLASLDAYASRHNTNRVQIIQTLIIDLLREEQTASPC